MPDRRRGVNLGNALDSLDGPGRPITAPQLELIRSAGFDTVRLPVAWAAHADPGPSYAIDPAFRRRVDDALDLAAAAGLAVIINVHHYRELMLQPARHEARFLALWRQLAGHLAGRSQPIAIELLNEPTAALDAEAWNRLLVPAWEIVREADRTVEVVIGSASMNGFEALAELELPRDPHVTATIHYYEPMPFTHQGADWIPGATFPVGRRWGTPDEVEAVQADLAAVRAWSDRHGIPVLVGEFGSHDRAVFGDRVHWTRVVREELDRHEFDWCYWDLTGDFGLYDLAAGRWRSELMEALGLDASGD